MQRSINKHDEKQIEKWKKEREGNRRTERGSKRRQAIQG